MSFQCCNINLFMHASPLLGPRCSTYLDIASSKEKWLGDLPEVQASDAALST